MSYSPQRESIKTAQWSIQSRPCPANPQANNYANTKIFASAVNELISQVGKQILAVHFSSSGAELSPLGM